MPKIIKPPDLSVLTRHTDLPPDRAPMGDTTVNVFTLGEVAEILEAPKSRIRNWTIGRPFKIVPQVRAFRGKGSRNLYSMQDVYLLALLSQLHNDGFSNKLIEHVIEEAALRPKLGPIHAIILRRSEGKWTARFFTGDFDWDRIKQMAAEWRGFYFLHLSALLNRVNERVTKLHEGE
jgi:DNA-binding transcriptional MerR regulator